MRLCCVFFTPKTAYEMRISDWSSDVCSSDLCTADSAGASTTCWSTTSVRPAASSSTTSVTSRGGSVADSAAGRRVTRSPPATNAAAVDSARSSVPPISRSEEHTSGTPVTNAHLVCRLLLEKKTQYTVHSSVMQLNNVNNSEQFTLYHTSLLRMQ